MQQHVDGKHNFLSTQRSPFPEGFSLPLLILLLIVSLLQSGPVSVVFQLNIIMAHHSQDNFEVQVAIENEVFKLLD